MSTPFKVGDKVKCIDPYGHLKNLAIYTVQAVTHSFVGVLPGKSAIHCHARFELVTAAATEAQPKVEIDLHIECAANGYTIYDTTPSKVNRGAVSPLYVATDITGLVAIVASLAKGEAVK